MKTPIKNSFLLFALMVTLNLLLPGRAPAQTFTNLYNFTKDVYNPATGLFANGDGAGPNADLILSGHTLYGTTYSGGSFDDGTVFKVNTDGTGFTSLHSFALRTYNQALGNYTNSDGTGLTAGVVQSGNTLYGMTYLGGNFGNGTVFAVNTDGTGFTNFHAFTAIDPLASTNSDGANPYGSFASSGNKLYGTTSAGGHFGSGTVFAINTDGTGFTNLYNFPASSADLSGNDTNSEGAGLLAGLIISGNTLYGNTYGGGSLGWGTVFKLNTDGTGITNLHDFDVASGEGGEPFGKLVLSGDSLYGTANVGGTGGFGTVFTLHTDGTDFKTLHIFSALISTNSQGNYTNADGYDMEDGLILSGNILYGTVSGGGPMGFGTIFAITTDGTGFATIHNFAETTRDSLNFATNNDGTFPFASLIISGNTLFGTAHAGGSFSSGTVFNLTLPPPPLLNITPFAAKAILSWPTNATSFPFTLQSTTNLISPAVWTTVSPASAVVNGQNTVTNLISNAQQFYRLSQ